MLEQLWEQSEYSTKDAEQIMARIDAMVAQVPAVIMQAHERIIAKRNVPNAEKILSVYEPEGHLIVRSKAGKEVEFGNSLFCAEAPKGACVSFGKT